MSWWRKNGPGEDSVSENGWVKIKSIWRKNGPGEDSVSVNGWVRIKTAWRLDSLVNGVASWIKIFGSPNPYPKSDSNLWFIESPYSSTSNKSIDADQTTGAAWQNSKMYFLRGKWYEDPIYFEVTFQQSDNNGLSWTTLDLPGISDIVVKKYLEYKDIDFDDKIPSSSSNWYTITLSDVQSGKYYRVKVRVSQSDTPTSVDLNDSIFYFPSEDGIAPRLKFAFNPYGADNDPNISGVSENETSSDYLNRKLAIQWRYNTSLVSASQNSNSYKHQIVWMEDFFGETVFGPVDVAVTNTATQSYTINYPQSVTENGGDYVVNVLTVANDAYWSANSLENHINSFTETSNLASFVWTLPQKPVTDNTHDIEEDSKNNRLNIGSGAVLLSKGNWTNVVEETTYLYKMRIYETNPLDPTAVLSNSDGVFTGLNQYVGKIASFTVTATNPGTGSITNRQTESLTKNYTIDNTPVVTITSPSVDTISANTDFQIQATITNYPTNITINTTDGGAGAAKNAGADYNNVVVTVPSNTATYSYQSPNLQYPSGGSRTITVRANPGDVYDFKNVIVPLSSITPGTVQIVVPCGDGKFALNDYFNIDPVGWVGDNGGDPNLILNYEYRYYVDGNLQNFSDEIPNKIGDFGEIVGSSISAEVRAFFYNSINLSQSIVTPWVSSPTYSIVAAPTYGEWGFWSICTDVDGVKKSSRSRTETVCGVTTIKTETKNCGWYCTTVGQGATCTCTQTVQATNISGTGSGYSTSCSESGFPSCSAPCTCNSTEEAKCTAWVRTYTADWSAFGECSATVFGISGTKTQTRPYVETRICPAGSSSTNENGVTTVILPSPCQTSRTGTEVNSVSCCKVGTETFDPRTIYGTYSEWTACGTAPSTSTRSRTITERVSTRTYSDDCTYVDGVSDTVTIDTQTANCWYCTEAYQGANCIPCGYSVAVFNNSGSGSGYNRSCSTSGYPSCSINCVCNSTEESKCTNWSSWSECTGPTGAKTRTRTRTCPSGSPCITTETQDCWYCTDSYNSNCAGCGYHIEGSNVSGGGNSFYSTACSRTGFPGCSTPCVCNSTLESQCGSWSRVEGTPTDWSACTAIGSIPGRQCRTTPYTQTRTCPAGSPCVTSESGNTQQCRDCCNTGTSCGEAVVTAGNWSEWTACSGSPLRQTRSRTTTTTQTCTTTAVDCSTTNTTTTTNGTQTESRDCWYCTTSVNSNCAGCTQTIEGSNISQSGSGYQISCSQAGYPNCQTPCTYWWCKTTRAETGYCALSGPHTSSQAGSSGTFITVCQQAASQPYTCQQSAPFFPPHFPPFFPPHFPPHFPPFFPPHFPPFFPPHFPQTSPFFPPHFPPFFPPHFPPHFPPFFPPHFPPFFPPHFPGGGGGGQLPI